MEKIPQVLSHFRESTAPLGALRWTAPEQIEEMYEKTAKGDIYSFGCVSLQAS